MLQPAPGRGTEGERGREREREREKKERKGEREREREEHYVPGPASKIFSPALKYTVCLRRGPLHYRVLRNMEQ